MADKKDLSSNPFTALFGSIEEAQQFINTQKPQQQPVSPTTGQHLLLVVYSLYGWIKLVDSLIATKISSWFTEVLLLWCSDDDKNEDDRTESETTTTEEAVPPTLSELAKEKLAVNAILEHIFLVTLDPGMNNL